MFNGDRQRKVRNFSSRTASSATPNFPRRAQLPEITSPKGLLANSQIEASAAREEIPAAFSMWKAVSNISFRIAPGPDKADILLGPSRPRRWVVYRAVVPAP